MNMFIDYEMVKAIDEIKRLRNELAVTEAAKRELAERNKEYEGNIICLQGELIALYKNFNDNKGEISKLKSERDALREVNSDLETENEKLYRQFIESEKARKGLVDDIERVKKDVKELIKENERLCRKKGNDSDD